MAPVFPNVLGRHPRYDQAAYLTDEIPIRIVNLSLYKIRTLVKEPLPDWQCVLITNDPTLKCDLRAYDHSLVLRWANNICLGCKQLKTKETKIF